MVKQRSNLLQFSQNIPRYASEYILKKTKQQQQQRNSNKFLDYLSFWTQKTTVFLLRFQPSEVTGFFIFSSLFCFVVALQEVRLAKTGQNAFIYSFVTTDPCCHCLMIITQQTLSPFNYSLILQTRKKIHPASISQRDLVKFQ